MSQALSRKWRPSTFDDVVGQEHITRTIKNSIAAGRIGHAYLFCGPRGTGKTTTARLIAKAVNCLQDEPANRPCNECRNCVDINNGRFLDLIEIDAASNTGVDDIRDLREKINFSPSQGAFKVYIIDEVHMLSTAAFNALLKTLEEPPAHAIFVLATTEEHKVPVTIKSRCQQFNNRLLSVEEIKQRLGWIAEREKITLEPEALSLIAKQGAGSIRDAESLLDQLVSSPGDTITLERTQMVLGTATETAVITLTDAWLNSDGGAGLAIIHDALSSGTDARQFCRQMVAYLRQLLLMQAAGQMLEVEMTPERKAEMLAQAQRAPRKALLEAVRGFNEAALSPAPSWQPQLPLELAFISLLPDQPAPFVAVAVRSTPEPTAPIIKEQPRREAPPARPQPSPPPEPEAPPEPEMEAEPEVEAEPEMEMEVETAAETAIAPPQPEQSKTAVLHLEQVRQQWSNMIGHIGDEHRNLPALLRMAKPLGIEGQTVVLGFDYPIFKNKFDTTSGAAQAVGEAFSQLLSSHVLVRCVVTSEYSVSISRSDVQSLADELGGVLREE